MPKARRALSTLKKRCNPSTGTTGRSRQCALTLSLSHRLTKADTKPQSLVRCPYFALEYVQSSEPYTWGGSEHLQAALILEGAGTLRLRGADEDVSRGQTWLLPATMPELECRPQGVLKTLLCTLP